MTVPRPTIEVKKWTVALFLQIPIPSLKQLERSSHSVAHEITTPIDIPLPCASLGFWDGPHSVWGVYL